MSKFVLLNTRIFTGGVDLTSNANKVELSAQREDKETTSFGSSGWKELIGGLGPASVSASGQWEAGDTTKVDDGMWSALGSVGAVSVYPDTANAGDLAWFTNALTSKYSLGGAVGDVAPWSASLSGAYPLVRGLGLHPPGTARTATGTGTAVLGTAVTSTQYLYAALHVLSVSGTGSPTITVKIQSDDNSGFTSATDQISFTAATAVTGEVKRVAGAITDTYFRASWTISGSSPSFLFAVSAGVA